MSFAKMPNANTLQADCYTVNLYIVFGVEDYYKDTWHFIPTFKTTIGHGGNALYCRKGKSFGIEAHYYDGDCTSYIINN